MSARVWVALASLLFASASLLASPAHADPVSDAFENVTACLQERDQLQVLAIVDESASLRRTDPESTRSAALETVVRNLAGVQQTESGAAAAVEIKVMTFATDVRDLTDWLLLESDTVGELLEASRELAERDAGMDTDFVFALTAARDTMEERIAQLADQGVSVCPVLLWFTDGDYDLEPFSRTVPYAPDLPLQEPGNPELAMQIGRELICETGGLADQLHDAGVITLTIGLGLEITEEDERFLTLFSEGSEGCGSGVRTGAGAYLSADDLNALLFAFDRASTGIVGGTLAGEHTVEPCIGESCPAGSTSFELDTSLERFHLLITAADTLRVEIAGPSGDPTVLERTEDARVVIDGAELSWTPLAGAFLVDGTLGADDPSWVGSWTVTFIDPTGDAGEVVGQFQVVLFGALTPRLISSDDVRVGEQATISVEAIDAEGTPRTPAELIGRTTIEVTISDPVSGDTIPAQVGPPDADGQRSVSFDVAPDIATSSLLAEARLMVTTVGGLELPERRDTLVLPLLPPATYPRVEPASLRIGPVAGRDPGRSELLVIGGEDPGCVWFGPATLSGPRDLGAVDLMVSGGHAEAESCLAIGPGQTLTLPVQVDREASAGGTANGSLEVLLASDVGDEVITLQVPVTIDFVREVDTGRRLAIFLAVFVLGLLLPLAFLAVVSRLAARFRDPALVRCALISVEVRDDRLVAQGAPAGDPALSLEPEQFRPIDAPGGDLPDVTLPGLQLGRRIPLWPLSPPTGTATSDARATVASGGRRRTQAGSIGLLSFGLPSQWVLGVDDHRHQGDGRVVVLGRLWVFINEGNPYQDIKDSVEARLQREVPAAARSLPVPPTESPDTTTEPGTDSPSPDREESGWRPPPDTSSGAPWSPTPDPEGAAWTDPARHADARRPGEADAPPPSPFTIDPDPLDPPVTDWRPPTD